jgi:hypothetical protein
VSDIKIMDDAEVARLLVAVIDGTGPPTRAELENRAQRVVRWAVQVRLDHVALGLVLSGRLDIVVPEDASADLAFRKVKQ